MVALVAQHKAKATELTVKFARDCFEAIGLPSMHRLIGTVEDRVRYALKSDDPQRISDALRFELERSSENLDAIAKVIAAEAHMTGVRSLAELHNAGAAHLLIAGIRAGQSDFAIELLHTFKYKSADLSTAMSEAVSRGQIKVSEAIGENANFGAGTAGCGSPPRLIRKALVLSGWLSSLRSR